jgi:hypothetical protein
MGANFAEFTANCPDIMLLATVSDSKAIVYAC